MTFRAACEAIVLALLLVGGFSSGYAQVAPPPTCTVTASVPPVVRAEGISELVGDIVLTCTGASAAPVNGNLTVLFNTNVTSRLVSGATSEALLLTDDPAPGSQTLGVNLFEGTVSAPNALTFSNVPLYPVSTGQGAYVLRLTNLRVNASALIPPGPVVGFVSAAGNAILLNNPQQTVAFIATPVGFSAAAAGQCSAATIALNFSESFAAQLKVRGTGQSTPGVVSSDESGFTPDPAIAGVGLADTGTLLSATISGLAAGTQLSVPASVSNGTLSLSAVSPAGGGVLSESGGAATVVYEVMAANPLATEAVSIPVTATGTKGQVSVQGSLAALSTVTVASASAPIPRFADRSIAEQVSIGPCAAVAAPATSSPALVALVILLLLGAAVVIRASGRARTV